MESIKDTKDRKRVAGTWQLDLASHEFIRTLVKLKPGLKRLDAVLRDASLLTMDYAEMEGNEITIAVNVVPLALITNSTKLHDVAK